MRAPEQPWLPLPTQGFVDAASGWRLYGLKLADGERMLYVAQTREERHETQTEVALNVAWVTLVIGVVSGLWLRRPVRRAFALAPRWLDGVRGYDAIIMKAFTQTLAETAVALALQKAFALLNPGGDLYIQAAILDDARTSPAWTVQFDLVLLNVYENGRAYTESEYRQWLTAAGFVSSERPDPSLIIAHKAANK